MSIGRRVLSIIAIVCGVFMVVYGGYDDSPGGQGLGLLLVIIGAVWLVKSRKKRSRD